MTWKVPANWVRTYAESGVDQLKITYDGIIAPAKLKPEVIAAIIDEAHKQGVRALVHPAERGGRARSCELADRRVCSPSGPDP